MQIEIFFGLHFFQMGGVLFHLHHFELMFLFIFFFCKGKHDEKLLFCDEGFSWKIMDQIGAQTAFFRLSFIQIVLYFPDSNIRHLTVHGVGPLMTNGVYSWSCEWSLPEQQC